MKVDAAEAGSRRLIVAAGFGETDQHTLGLMRELESHGYCATICHPPVGRAHPNLPNDPVRQYKQSVLEARRANPGGRIGYLAHSFGAIAVAAAESEWSDESGGVDFIVIMQPPEPGENETMLSLLFRGLRNAQFFPGKSIPGHSGEIKRRTSAGHRAQARHIAKGLPSALRQIAASADCNLQEYLGRLAERHIPIFMVYADGDKLFALPGEERLARYATLGALCVQLQSDGEHHFSHDTFWVDYEQTVAVVEWCAASANGQTVLLSAA